MLEEGKDNEPKTNLELASEMATKAWMEKHGFPLSIPGRVLERSGRTGANRSDTHALSTPLRRTRGCLVMFMAGPTPSSYQR
jgi:hypothetical protein